MNLTAAGRPLVSGLVALAVLAALIAALASPARADLEPDAELRVWQSVADPSRHWISARPSADAAWRTTEVAMALDAASAWRTGGLTVDARGGGSLELRLWQDPDDHAALHLSARAAGASWREHGTQPITLDEERADGAYRYLDLTVTLEEPRTEPAPPGEPRDAICPPDGRATEDASVRIWRAEDPARHWISSRPDGDAAWSTVPVSLAATGDADSDDGDAAPWNAGALVIDAGDADFELRLWERDGEIRLSARVAGTTWDEYGTQEVELDESRTIRGTDYAYADRELALTLPAAEPAPPGESLPSWDCPVATPTPTPAPAPVFVPSGPPPNARPIANAGPDQSAAAGDTVTLDGSGSSDDGGKANLEYAWTRDDNKTTGVLADADKASASFTVPSAADAGDAWAFSLEVTDKGNLSATDTVTVTVPGLTVTGISGTGATLNFAGRSTQWWYQRTEGPSSTTCSSVAGGTTTATLSSLTADTLYGYTAYSASGCAAANAIATVHFSTTDHGAGNLDEAAETATCTIGYSSTANVRCAVAFTTGAASNGYALKSIAAAFAAKSGAPGDLTVAIHAADTANSSNPAATALVTLSGSDPDTAGIHEYACSGLSCNLWANTTYFVVMSTTDSSGTARGYKLRTTLSDGETLHPATNGWSLADAGRTKSGTSAWAAAGSGRTPMLHVAAAARPGPSGGQTVTGSNLTRAVGGDAILAGGAHGVYNGFTTGSSPGGYTLSSATLRIQTWHPAGTTNPTGTLDVTLHADSGGLPVTGTALATLSGGPTHPTGGAVLATYTCSGTGCSLAANTRYYVLAIISQGTLKGHWRVTGIGATDWDVTPANNGWTYHGFSRPDRSCPLCTPSYAHMQVTATAHAGLEASGVASTTATLTLHRHDAAWWYEGDQSGATCTSVDAGTNAVNLASLTAGTTYTYKAYSASGCASANELDSVTFTTTN